MELFKIRTIHQGLELVAFMAITLRNKPIKTQKYYKKAPEQCSRAFCQ